MCSLITLLNILMNKKARHIGKRKAGSSARKLLRKLHTSEYANSCFKKKKIVLYFKEDTIDSEKLQSAMPSLTSRERTVMGPLPQPDPFWRIRTESEMPCYYSITQNPIFAEAILKFRQAHKHLHLTKYIYNEGIQAFSK